MSKLEGDCEPWLKGGHVKFDPTGLALSRAELDATVLSTVEAPEQLGWGQKRRLRYSYYRPGEYYAGIVGKCLKDGDSWLDVGGGNRLFPGHRALEERMSKRASRLVAVDPNENVLKNQLSHENVQSLLEDFNTLEKFDIVTARMVVEHVEDPSSFLNAVFDFLRPGGFLIVYTVNLWSVVTCVSRVVPDAIHNPVKKVFWNTAPENTFPTVYKLNTRRALQEAASEAGLNEVFYALLDDCSIFSGFRVLGTLELIAWQTISTIKMPYPERNIVAVFTKT